MSDITAPHMSVSFRPPGLTGRDSSMGVGNREQTHVRDGDDESHARVRGSVAAAGVARRRPQIDQQHEGEKKRVAVYFKYARMEEENRPGPHKHIEREIEVLLG